VGRHGTKVRKRLPLLWDLLVAVRKQFKDGRDAGNAAHATVGQILRRGGPAQDSPNTTDSLIGILDGEVYVRAAGS
jgi:hypothetical protein